MQYMTNSNIPNDNNGAYNGIRPFVIGRQNWLFADTSKGTHAIANFYSIIETAKACGHDAYHYLYYLCSELLKAKTDSDIEKLMPWSVPKKTKGTLLQNRLSVVN